MRQTFSGPLNSKTKKEYLVEIALALKDSGLDSVLTDGNRSDLRKSIETILVAHEGSLSADPKFQGLYVHRSGAENTTKESKKSTDKDKEDTAAAIQDVGKEATGANKKLLDMQMRTDPPPQFARLTLPPKSGLDKAMEDDPALSSELSPAPSSDIAGGISSQPLSQEESSRQHEMLNSTFAASPTDDCAGGKAQDEGQTQDVVTGSTEKDATDVHTGEKVGEAAQNENILSSGSISKEACQGSVSNEGAPPETAPCSVAASQASQDALPDTILVRLADSTQGSERTNDVWLGVDGKNGIQLNANKTSDGSSVKYSTSLSQVIPAILDHHSPIKGISGRFFRPGIANKDQLVNLGTVEAFATKKVLFPSARADTYDLEKDEHGYYCCDLFLKREDARGPSASQPSLLESEKPLNLAKKRREERKEDKKIAREARLKAHDASLYDLIEFIRLCLGLPSEDRDPAKTMNDVRERYMEFLEVERKLREEQNWSKSRGKYTIVIDENVTDEDVKKFDGISFDKLTLYTAFGLGKSQMLSDQKRFSSDTFKFAPKVKEWLDNPTDEKLAKKFANMKPADFDRYLKRKQEEYDESEESEEVAKKARSRKNMTKKRRSQGSSDEEEPERKIKKRKKKAATPETDDDKAGEEEPKRKAGKKKGTAKASEHRKGKKKRDDRSSASGEVNSSDLDSN